MPGHNPLTDHDLICSLRERMKKQTIINDINGCWEWQGYRTKFGYGQIGYGRGLILYTHRVAYILEYGLIPESAYVLHICDNPPCVNPAHLEVGTQQDNMNDAKIRGRMPKGENNANSKLTEEIVREIIAEYINGISSEELGNRYNLHKSYIARIIRGERWGYLWTEEEIKEHIKVAKSRNRWNNNAWKEKGEHS